MSEMNDHKLLLELQVIDSKLDELEVKEKKLPERDQYLKLKEEVAKIEALLKTMTDKLKIEAATEKTLDDELKTLSTKVERDQNRLYSGLVVNPKELANVQQEVTHLKELIDDKELALLEQIEVVDKMKSDNDAVEARLKVRTADMQSVKAKMDSILNEIASSRAIYKAEREPVFTAASADARELYERIRKKHLVAVTVLENGLCRGCRVELPSTDYERIEQSTKLERCTNCSRIIAKENG
ncbi:MAG: hypothetical protein HY779_04425 [Rubrobacteridae bacterium]|nr:hypothetical protein [Rubrobacteridae bacterium]